MLNSINFISGLNTESTVTVVSAAAIA